jgi:hypothetical protein
MRDFWGECFDPRAEMPAKTFERTFCRVCMNPGCERSAATGLSWSRRMATQTERLFTNPSFADPDDPRFREIRKIDFPSAVQEAMRLEISDRRGDWSVPTAEDAQRLAASMAAKSPPPGRTSAPAPAPPPPTEKVVQQYTIRGSSGEDYDVTLFEPAAGGPPRWKCTCKAFEFGGGKPCKHIAYAVTLPPEDEPEPAPPPKPAPAPTPAQFQAGGQRPAAQPPKPAAAPQRPFFPPAGNIPMPPGGVMVDGSLPPPPKSRPASAAPATPVVDPWAPPPPKPKVIPVGGKVVLGGGGEKK